MDVTSVDDEFLQLANECVEKVTEATLPGRFWVEVAPIVRHLPGWVPGVNFKRFVEDLNPKLEKVLNTPFENVQRGWVRPSQLTRVLALALLTWREDNRAGRAFYNGNSTRETT